MCVSAPEMSAAQVLSAFHRDAPYLFLGAAFVTVGVLSAAFSALRRKHDTLFLYFAIFAVLYGIRLWIQAALLEISIRGSWFYPRFANAQASRASHDFVQRAVAN
jgi:phosphoserine phosphatase RsbU/P